MGKARQEVLDALRAARSDISSLGSLRPKFQNCSSLRCDIGELSPIVPVPAESASRPVNRSTSSTIDVSAFSPAEPEQSTAKGGVDRWNSKQYLDQVLYRARNGGCETPPRVKAETAAAAVPVAAQPASAMQWEVKRPLFHSPEHLCTGEQRARECSRVGMRDRDREAEYARAGEHEREWDYVRETERAEAKARERDETARHLASQDCERAERERERMSLQELKDKGRRAREMEMARDAERKGTQAANLPSPSSDLRRERQRERERGGVAERERDWVLERQHLEDLLHIEKERVHRECRNVVKEREDRCACEMEHEKLASQLDALNKTIAVSDSDNPQHWGAQRRRALTRRHRAPTGSGQSNAVKRGECIQCHVHSLSCGQEGSAFTASLPSTLLMHSPLGSSNAFLPPYPHASGPIQWARGDVGKAFRRCTPRFMAPRLFDSIRVSNAWSHQ